jgi:hypothetical protein
VYHVYFAQAIYPERNLRKGELVICPEVKALLGRAFIHMGTGQSVMDDRLYIKVRMWNMLDGPR